MFMMKFLITGFEPFGGERTNPAYEAVKGLPDRIEDIEIIKSEIPTAFHLSIQKVEALIKNHMPDVVICVGQAGGRSNVTLERIGINIDDAGIPDNQGKQPIDEAIYLDGPAAYFSTLPIKAIVKTLRENGIPAGVSNSAGTYVCNHIMYGLLHVLKTEYPGVRGGFIHVPYCESQVVDRPNVPSMNLASLTKALQLAIKCTYESNRDIKMTDGVDC
jgi:pyroglutamyl-peptidase